MRVLLRWVGIPVVVLLGLVGLGWGGLHVMRAVVADPDQAPERATGRRDVPASTAETYMVAAAHPLAVEAGRTVLAAGGSAADAAVAVQAMLTLVEPQSSGIGGGAFMLYHPSGEALQAWDGRETAPAAASPELFVGADGQPEAFMQAVIGGRSVGVPGVVRMLWEVHQAHGKRPWAELFQPAIRAAREGFEVTPRLHQLLALDAAFRTMPAAQALYYDGLGRAKPVGARLQNPELADALHLIATEGPSGFYEGPLAEAMVRAVAEAKQPSEDLLAANRWLLDFGLPFGTGLDAGQPVAGSLGLEDLKAYAPKQRTPVCIRYRERFRVCGHPPPTSGGITTLQIIGMLAHHDLSRFAPDSVEVAHLLAEAGHLAFADRGRYIGDPDFVDVPTEGLLDPSYLEKRAGLIRLDAAAKKVRAGKPAGRPEGAWLSDPSPSLPSTSHFAVFDTEGDVVSMTTSVENAFGSRLVVSGFILNNQLTDFAFVPDKDGVRVANALAPGKRPRSSMSPLLIYDADGTPVLAIGSPGGSRIIGYTAQAALGVMEWGLDPQEAVELPHVVGRGGPVEVEAGGWAEGQQQAVVEGLERLGHEVRVVPQTSGLHAIQRKPDGLHGGADPRREGEARGD